jgi:hypothetical protein
MPFERIKGTNAFRKLTEMQKIRQRQTKERIHAIRCTRVNLRLGSFKADHLRRYVSSHFRM